MNTHRRIHAHFAPSPRGGDGSGWKLGLAIAIAGALPHLPLLARQASQPSVSAQAPAVSAARPCRVRGVVTSGPERLPGVAVTVREGETVRGLTSSDIDGSFTVALPSGAYLVRLELSGFAAVERRVTLGTTPCDATVDADMTLASRVPGATLPPAPPAAPVAAGGARGGVQDGRGFPGGGFPGGGFPGGGRGGRGAAAPRFQTLTVEQAATAAGADDAVLSATLRPEDDPATRLLPPGFAAGTADDAVTVSGTVVQLDRALIDQRAAALARGEFGLGDTPLGPQVAAGFAQVGVGDTLGPAGGGRGGGGGGGFGGLGGRGGGSAFQVNATYGLGGSMFDAAPYSLRGEPVTKRDYLQQNFSTTLGGALKIPGVYDGTNRTTYNLSYTAARNGNLFDQYATVPSEAYRRGDFSASAVPIIDPLTGSPFAGNQIPAERMSAAALALLPFIPAANLPGDTRNFHLSETTRSTTDTISLRISHTLTQPQAGRGGRGGGRGGGAAGGRGAGGNTAAGTTGAAAGSTPGSAPPAGAGNTAGSPAGQTAPPGPAAQPAAGQGGAGRGGPGAAGPGRGGRGTFAPPLNVSVSATLNYRHNDGDRSNVFPSLAGTTRGTTVSVPFNLNIRAGRSMHAISGSVSRTSSTTLNDFAFTRNVASEAGITGVATDPFDWGVPSLSFGTFTGLRDTAPSRRLDRSWQLTYGLTRPAGTHNWRVGGSYQTQLNRTQSDSNARGTFTFTGLYTAGGLSTVRGSGQDFADFLLGLPQQATRQYGVTTDDISSLVTIRGRQFNLYVQDDWRWKARWTINYGLQYDFVQPYTETSGRMVNLDASSDFTSVAAVMPGEVGPYSGLYGSGLVNTDWNNLAPKVGVAWRATNRAVVRFGYGLSYNSGSYSTIARNLYQQPPFFRTATVTGTLDDPLLLTDAFSGIASGTITNNYGIDRDYQLGLIHQWNVDYSRTLLSSWNVGATYIGTRGANLDMLRAPNRGPDGLRIPDVQSFTWQSDDGSSYMNGLSVRLQKRQTRGISGSVSYTLSKSRDNTTATGGNATVAQDDRNLDAEWALSNFDRRHQFTGSANLELPWGRNRRWLANGGWLAQVVGDWSMSANLTVQSGTPLTARCSSCAANVAQGVVGTLRANYTGAAIGLSDPTIDQYFNTSAFSIPAVGSFGNSLRNMIVGPGSRALNAQFTRDVALGGTRNVSLTVNANNLLNLVNYGGIDTNVNSPTFGQVTSVNGRRSVRVNMRFRF